jgi:hypothetical protein
LAVLIAGALSLAVALPSGAAAGCPTQARIGAGPAAIPRHIRLESLFL